MFPAFAYCGGYLPQNWGIAHAGIDFAQIVNALVNEQSGFYGIPLDVAATYIVLLTIYGARPQHLRRGRPTRWPPGCAARCR